MGGKDCIQKRLKAIEKGKDVPDDILTRILKRTCKSVQYLHCLNNHSTNVAPERIADIETLTDYFVNIHHGGTVICNVHA